MEGPINDDVLSCEDIDYVYKLVFQLEPFKIQIILDDFHINPISGKHIIMKQILDNLTGPRSKSMQILEQRILQMSLIKDLTPSLKIQELLQKYQHISKTCIPTIRFAHDLPFFRTIHSLTNPIHCKGNDISIFNLTKLYNEIKNVPDYINQSWNSERKEHKIQIILRLEQVGLTKTFNGCLPSNIQVSLNNVDCKLPKLIGQIEDEGRYNAPINITEQINFNKHEQNTLKITWSIYPHTYVAGVFLSEKLTSKDLLEKLKTRRSSNVTKEFIKNSMENNYGMGVDYLSVTLKDPLTIQRMKLPARGEECKHLQCFDAIQFLQMNELKQTWTCPLCKEQVKFENIVIDDFFLSILQSSNLSKESDKIILLKDGTWTESKTKVYTSSNNEEILLTDSDENKINENVDNKEIEPTFKRLKCNPRKEKKPKYIAKTVSVLERNVNSSTKCDIVKNNSTSSASDNQIIMLNNTPGPSSAIRSNCMLNNFNHPNNKNSANFDNSVRSQGNKNQEKNKSKSVICVITLD